MKKITLRNLPPEIQRSIKRKALNEDISREQAVIEILREAELQRIADREIGIVETRLAESKAF